MSWFSRFFKPAKQPPKEPFQWPSDLPPAKELVDQLYHKDALQASLMETQDGPIEDEKTSVLGNVLVGLENEKWPEYQGKKMVGIAQINLEESTVIPGCLKDLKFITVFMARGDDQWSIDFPTDDETKKAKCIIRSYQKMEQLVSYKDAPETPGDITPHKVTYRTIHDPNPEWNLDIPDYKEKYGQEVFDILEKTLEDEINQSEEIWGSKVGGYPAPIQDNSDQPLAFQLGCENDVGFQWLDSGCVYFWRNLPDTGDEWEFDIEFY